MLHAAERGGLFPQHILPPPALTTWQAEGTRLSRASRAPPLLPQSSPRMHRCRHPHRRSSLGTPILILMIPRYPARGAGPAMLLASLSPYSPIYT
ncbi:hypothetical protein T440DRAFT_466311 [Plenodomus tracheiphilus IPT5]|uniref:Uncharacterized protein n=1 Tax=Plenodomus tracheiphilus IPT5 TaxID=1408161 RepID=A0A6A7BFR9_9PLEO|nr:hypothetical protein T440DRAFT_466311 [Plenodomus tracheiphilus IPT5]